MPFAPPGNLPALFIGLRISGGISQTLYQGRSKLVWVLHSERLTSLKEFCIPSWAEHLGPGGLHTYLTLGSPACPFPKTAQQLWGMCRIDPSVNLLFSLDFKDLEGRTIISLNILSCFISDVVLSLGIQHVDVSDSIRECGPWTEGVSRKGHRLLMVSHSLTVRTRHVGFVI